MSTPFIFHWIFDTQSTIWSFQLIISLSITSIFATLFGIGAMVWAQKIIFPSRIAIIFSMEPVFAAIFAMLIIGEYLTLIEWIGGFLIIAGVIYSETNNS